MISKTKSANSRRPVCAYSDADAWVCHGTNAGFRRWRWRARQRSNAAAQRSREGATASPSAHRLGLKQQRFPRVEVPVFAVALAGKEEGAEPEIVVRERIDSRREHAQLFEELPSGGAFQDCETGHGGGTELCSRALDNGSPPVADVAEIAPQIEAEISSRRVSNRRAPAQLSQTSQGQRCQKPANGVVGGRILAPARPVLVGQRSVGRQVGGHPPTDTRCQISRAVFVRRRSRVDQGRAANQLHRLSAGSARQQELPGGERSQGAAGAELVSIDPAVLQEPLQRPFEPEVGGEHPRRGIPSRFSAKRDFEADKPAGAIEEDPGESIHSDAAEVIGDADFELLVRERADPPSQLGQGSGVYPTVALRRAIPPNTKPSSATGVVWQFQLDTIRIEGFSLRGEGWFGMDISNGWRISATNSARPLTPVFA